MVSTNAVEPPSLKARLAKLGVTIGAIWGGVYVIAAAGAPLEYSRRFLPEPLHLLVLLLYSVGLAYLLTWIFTERARSENSTRILVWFGPYGLVLLPLLIMAVSALVLGSFTATLFHHGWIELSPGSASEVSEASLKDFYVWHLLDLVPFVEIPQTLKWDEPVLYTQARVGWLVLFYQALVVVPSIAAIRWYWKKKRG